MRIYISGPITGVKDAGERFQETEKKLRERFPNADIINPFHTGVIYPNLEHSQYMDVSFSLMNACTHIYQMDGWEASVGCNQEKGYAESEGIKFIDDSDPIDNYCIEIPLPTGISKDTAKKMYRDFMLSIQTTDDVESFAEKYPECKYKLIHQHEPGVSEYDS